MQASELDCALVFTLASRRRCSPEPCRSRRFTPNDPQCNILTFRERNIRFLKTANGSASDDTKARRHFVEMLSVRRAVPIIFVPREPGTLSRHPILIAPRIAFTITLNLAPVAILCDC